MTSKSFSFEGTGRPASPKGYIGEGGVSAVPPSLKSEPKFKVYGVLEMWEAYHLGKNDGTIKDMEYLLSKKVE